MIQDQITTAEQHWLGRAYDYCRSCFAEVFLPSHDETHHLRTWYFARSLLPVVHDHLFSLTPDEITGLLLASLLHDTGMSETLSPAHGPAGRRLAERFFATLPEPPALTEAILTAIEKHDDKSYRGNPSPHTPAGRILTLLAVADDLDALGYTGIYRYHEIYSLRNISPAEMAMKVCDNLESRFRNMTPLLSADPQLLETHRQRYTITYTFFNNLAGKNKEAALTVIHFLKENKGKKPEEMKELQPGGAEQIKNNDLKNFLYGWKNELNL